MASNSAIVARPDAGVLVIFFIIAVLLVSALVLGVVSGVTDISIVTVWKVALSKVIPDAVEVDWTGAHERIIWELRLPRVLLAALTGAGLALSGAALQATTRNPLADPFLLGVSAGAALGAVAVISHIGAFAGIYSLPTAAFIGGALSLSLLIGVLGREGAARSDRVILAGVAISFLLMAGTNLLIFLGDQRASHSVVFWMLGGLGRARWDHLWIPAGTVLLGAIWLIWKARALNALMIGGRKRLFSWRPYRTPAADRTRLNGFDDERAGFFDRYYWFRRLGGPTHLEILGRRRQSQATAALRDRWRPLPGHRRHCRPHDHCAPRGADRYHHRRRRRRLLLLAHRQKSITGMLRSGS